MGALGVVWCVVGYHRTGATIHRMVVEGVALIGARRSRAAVMAIGGVATTTEECHVVGD
jgi:hypothetical protein